MLTDETSVFKLDGSTSHIIGNPAWFVVVHFGSAGDDLFLSQAEDSHLPRNNNKVLYINLSKPSYYMAGGTFGEMECSDWLRHSDQQSLLSRNGQVHYGIWFSSTSGSRLGWKGGAQTRSSN